MYRLGSERSLSPLITAMGSGSLPARGKYHAYTQESLAFAVDEGRRDVASGKAGNRGHSLSAIATKHGIPWPKKHILPSLKTVKRSKVLLKYY
jgi:hypothetical protein